MTNRIKRLLGTARRGFRRRRVSDLETISRLLSPMNAVSQPNINALSNAMRDIPNVRWDTKVMGYAIAHLLLGTTEIGKLPAKNLPFTPGWRPTISDDFFLSWFRDACALLNVEPILHRKLWEFAYTLGCLSHFDKLKPGVRGIGFGCGKEPLPSLFAAKGVSVLVTDLDPSRQAAKGWVDTTQHTSDLEVAWRPNLVQRVVFDANVSHRYVDMNEIPGDLGGGFDFCWSICALEHLGSISKGLAFIRNSLDTLRPGGIAVHTTEFNCFSDDETIDDWPTVLFRKRDISAIYQRLRDEGFELPSISFATGETPIDWFVDVPPYSWQAEYYDTSLPRVPHLKVSVDGIPSTCFGIVVRKPG